MKLKALRMVVLTVLVVGIMCSFTLRLMSYQIIDGASYRVAADKTTVQLVPVVAPRGDILDRYGNILATNQQFYTIMLDKTGFPTKDAEKENATILQLCTILKNNGMMWQENIPISLTQPYTFSQVKSSLNNLKKLLKITDDNEFTPDNVMSLLINRYKVSAEYTAEQVREIVGVRYQMEIKQFSLSNVFTYATNVNLDVINQISEQSVPGVVIGASYSRIYTDGTLAPQVIGNVGPIYAKDVKKYTDLKYPLDAIVGRGGVEQYMESYLRGIDGIDDVEINNQGIVTSRAPDAQKPAKSGDNVVLTIDAGMQRMLQTSLQNAISNIAAEARGDATKGANCKAGAAVVLNIKTGEVLAMASTPGYDNNTYTQNYNAISTTPGDPLLNRAVQSTYRPGSTFKPCTAVSGLMNNVIDENTTIYCGGTFTKGTYIGGDDGMAYGNIAVRRALTVSSNVFFNTLADRISGVVGGSTMLENTAASLGLGKLTGIELPGEKPGIISGPTYAKDTGKIWNPADPAQSGIGQLYNSFSPIQLANYVGGIVNGGTRYQVHIVKKVTSHDGTNTVLENQPKVVSGDFKIPDHIVQVVKEGMRGVTTDGTAAAVFADLSLQVGGKTGTSQVLTADGLQGWNGLFVSFAPYDDPQIVVAVAVENAAWGSQTSYVAKDVFNYMYLNGQLDQTAPLPTSTDTLLN